MEIPENYDRYWKPEPSVSFEYPSLDRETDLLRDFCRQRYQRALCAEDLEWLAEFCQDYFRWSRDHCTRNELRIAAQRCLEILVKIDQVMSASRDPSRTWWEIATALAFPSVCFARVSGRAMGNSRGLSKMAISKSVHKFLALIEMGPAFSNNGHHLIF